MLFSAAEGHKVVSTSTAETVGRVDALIVDPGARHVVALALKKTASGDTLAWPDLLAFGDDAVTVTDAAAIKDMDARVTPLAAKERRPLGKRVLTTAGDELGKLVDVDFDAATGALTALVLDREHIAAERLVGIGSYAVVVRA